MMISGLYYFPDFLDASTQKTLLHQIDQQTWSHELKRRVQHYGYRYDYRARKVDSRLRLGLLPEWLTVFADQLYQRRIFDSVPDQIIINEDVPGQGIAAHVDCEPCFGEVIASLSLGSACIMRFSNDADNRVVDVPLQAGSLIVLSDEARYQWKHAIPARKSDIINGKKRIRRRRVSVTFRSVML